MSWQFLMLGTTSVREPSSFFRSMASPRFTAPGSTRVGLPSALVYELFISGTAVNAFSSA